MIYLTRLIFFDPGKDLLGLKGNNLVAFGSCPRRSLIPTLATAGRTEAGSMGLTPLARRLCVCSVQWIKFRTGWMERLVMDRPWQGMDIGKANGWKGLASLDGQILFFFIVQPFLKDCMDDIITLTKQKQVEGYPPNCCAYIIALYFPFPGSERAVLFIFFPFPWPRLLPSSILVSNFPVCGWGSRIFERQEKDG